MSEQGRCAVDNSAAAAAAYTAASMAETVPCGAHLHQWGSLEHDFATADRHEKAIALHLIGNICRPCPALEGCAAWASEDKYTGFAAGTWYFSGARRPTSRAR